ncbi:MAG: class I SAM-dependent methyltransferase [Thermoleophilaceae bacterium]
MVGASVDVRDAAAALAPATVDELAAAGLVERDGSRRVRAAIAIRPYGNLLIASDRNPGTLAERADFVPGPNPVSRLLARHTIRMTVGRALDLGTGNGIQALAAASHAGEVLGTDINPRALAYAGLNVRLNATGNVRVAAGAWFEPLDERPFDLIVANPPFVISPDADLVYRDSGLGPGELSATLLRAIGDRLQAGGFGHMTCEWGVRDGEDWSATPRRWVAGTGCDAVVLRHAVFDPIEHAVGWNRRLLGVAPDRFEDAVERWAGHHREHGFVAIAAGTVVLRRRSGAGTPWFSALELAAGPSSEAGHHVRRIFTGEDLVRAAGAHPERLLAERLLPAEGLRVEQTLTTRGGRWHQRQARLRIQPGLGLDARVDTGALDVVFELDGQRDVEEVVRRVAARRGEDEQALRAFALAELPGLVRRGLVVRFSDIPGEDR